MRQRPGLHVVGSPRVTTVAGAWIPITAAHFLASLLVRCAKTLSLIKAVANCTVKFLMNSARDLEYPFARINKKALNVATSSMLKYKSRGHRVVFLRQVNSSIFSSNVSTPPHFSFEAKFFFCAI
jgi:hypothetical protein